MKIKSVYTTFLFIGIWLISIACQEPPKYAIAESNLDCVRKFISASLKGDIEQAKFYLIQDSLNTTLLEKWHHKYLKLSKTERDNYTNSHIVILKDSVINDSTSVISYYNSFKKTPTHIKVFRLKNDFFIDLKHTFYGEMYY